jgi:hypothetical protein
MKPLKSAMSVWQRNCLLTNIRLGWSKAGSGNRETRGKAKSRRKVSIMGKKRGRPSVTEKIAGDNAKTYEKIITSGKMYRSKRSVADTAYALAAAGVLSEAASEIQDLDLIFRPDYMCRSILNQLGRMLRIEGYSKNDVIAIAKEAIQGKKDGRSVKEIEKYIIHGRQTGEW